MFHEKRCEAFKEEYLMVMNFTRLVGKCKEIKQKSVCKYYFNIGEIQARTYKMRKKGDLQGLYIFGDC